MVRAALAVCLSLHLGAAALPAQPAGFALETVVSGSIHLGVAMAFAPDGRLFVCERTTGDIRVVAGGQLGGVWAHVDAVNEAPSEAGLLGIAIDPDFMRNGFVYVYFTRQVGGLTEHVLARLRDAGGAGGSFTVLHTFPGTGRHCGGPMEFGHDGKLYVAIGEQGFTAPAQSLSNPYGKILRLNAPDGSVPADNPFAATPGADGRIWSYGHRNPFGVAVHPDNGLVYCTENGSFLADEVNRVVAGGNQGWPFYEGSEPLPDPLTEDPLWTWTPSVAPTNPCFYTGALYPAEYRGAFFATRFLDRKITRLTLNSAGTAVLSETDFHAFAGTVLDVVDGPDGNLWALSSDVPARGSDSVTRFVHAAAPSPSANLSAVANKALGGAVTLGFVGRNGDLVVPWLSFSRLAAPVATRWGELWVPVDIPLPAVPITADDRAYLGVPLPDLPALAGQPLHLQAGVVRGTTAVLTNPASLTLR